MGNLFISELFAKALVLILSILVAREFGDSVSLDIFTWTLFFYVSIHSWLFGTLEYTIVPTFSELDDDGRGLALTSLLAFATGIMAVITPVLAMNYESIFSALTSFDSAAVGEFYRFFLILFIYFFANTVYSIFELSINQKNIYVLPVVLRGIINPLIIIAFILLPVDSFEKYVFGYAGAHVVILVLIAVSCRSELIVTTGSVDLFRRYILVFFTRGFPILGSQVLNSAAEFLLRYLLTGLSVGTLFFYGVSSKLVVVINSIFANTIIKVGFTELSRLIAEKDTRHKNLYGDLFRSVYFYSSMCAAFFLVIAEKVAELFYSGGAISTDQTAEVGRIFEILIFGIVPSSLHALNWKYLSALNKTKVFLVWAIPNTTIAILVIYYFASTAELAALCEVFLAFYSLIFYSVYIAWITGYTVSLRDVKFFSVVLLGCLANFFVLSKVVAFGAGFLIFDIILCGIIFSVILVGMAAIARSIDSFSYSHLKAFGRRNF